MEGGGREGRRLFLLCLTVINLKLKYRSMKDGFIENKVSRRNDISFKIQEFIQEKTAHQYLPFQDENSTQGKPSKTKCKRSLTDWRQLYHNNENKIVPRQCGYPSTADGVRARASFSGQCNRRKICSSAIAGNSYQGDRNFLTRQTRRSKFSESKRESMLDIAITQKIYETDVLKDEPASSSKQKRYYSKLVGPRREDYAKMNQLLSRVEICPPQFNATEDYIGSHMKEELRFRKVHECNRVKIKESSKLNNDRFLNTMHQLASRKKALFYESGLRFYQRG